MENPYLGSSGRSGLYYRIQLSNGSRLHGWWVKPPPPVEAIGWWTLTSDVQQERWNDINPEHISWVRSIPEPDDDA